MTVTTTITGGLCPECGKFGMQKIGTVPAGKNAFKDVLRCRFCGTRTER